MIRVGGGGGGGGGGGVGWGTLQKKTLTRSY